MESSSRRDFIKKLGLGTVTTSVLPASFKDTPQPIEESARKSNFKGKLRRQEDRPYNGVYQNEYLNRVAFPIGGIGAGMFCIEGTGAISHMSVRNRPEIYHEPSMFAAISVKGLEKGAKVLEGPVPDWKKFGQRSTGNGSAGSVYGLPRFQNVDFLARFPFCTLNLSDDDLPLDVQLTAWNPFIPTDEDSSSLPVGMMEYSFKNTGKQEVEAIFSYNSKNFLNADEEGVPNKIQRLKNGFVLTQEGSEEKPYLLSNFAIFTDQPNTQVDHCWFRGGWWDPLTMAWEAVKAGEMPNNDPVEADAPGASLYVPFSLAAGEEKTIRLMTCWYAPFTDMKFGGEGETDPSCNPSEGCCNTTSELGVISDNLTQPSPKYQPWYSHRFKDIFEVADFWMNNYQDLYEKSALFRDTFYNSTLPDEVIEAVAANLTIIKSTTVLRQYDGRLWNFEGCHDTGGCCHGSCTHVWNYAQAIPHLFPALERTMRHTEFCESQNAEGHQTFRSALPIRPVDHGFHAASDGQLGGIMKVHREWRISGDKDWLSKMYPLVKQSMDYCIQTWDPAGKGVLEEPHHNTYDIEFWGPDGMCSSFYLGALNAMIQMGDFLKKDVKQYKKLYAAGKKYVEEELFNGEYFIQKIKVDGLQAANPIEASAISMGGHYSDEARTLLEKEGPKYQYGSGCLSDGVLGSWIASMCNLEEPLDAAKTTSHLVSIHKYNLKDNLSDHANPQRPSYALGDEAGLLLCSWPKGGKLSLPFVYSDEVWTGIEYQVASHLMLMGKVEEGLDIVRACRDRYDGKVRNPFNEYECGHWYARAMSSYGMLQGLTGVRYDAVDKTLYIDSKVGNDFTSFLSTNTGFANVGLKNGEPVLDVKFGNIDVQQYSVSGKKIPVRKS